MPWTKSDAEKYNKGLSDKKKAQWAAVANSVLQQCMKKGGTESSCAGKAIKQANGVVKTNSLVMNISNNESYTIRREQLNGQEHIIVPVTMMKEGVHNGSHGPVLHTADVIGENIKQWDGMPIVINHPKDDDGYISAMEVPEQWVGEIRNANYNEGLKGEAWLNVAQLKQQSDRTYNYILSQKPLNVSIGVFSDDLDEEGVWNNEQYHAIASNYQADHLALLPDGVGACSLDDGCGIRANEKGGKMPRNQFTLQKPDGSDFAVHLSVNAVGYREIMRTIQDKLNLMDNSMAVHYLEDVFENYVIYEVSRRKGETSERTLWKQPYQVNADETIELVGDPVEVKKKVDYTVLEEHDEIHLHRKNNTNKEDKNMPNSKNPCEQCKKLVDNLIANESTKFTEDDREWLMALEENQLARIIPTAKEPVVNKDQALQVLKESIKDNEDFLNIVPDDMREQLREGLALHKAQKESLVTKIMTNSDEGTWSKEELNAMDMGTLKKIAAFVKDPVDYSANGGVPEPQNNEEILVLPDVEIKE